MHLWIIRNSVKLQCELWTVTVNLWRRSAMRIVAIVPSSARLESGHGRKFGISDLALWNWYTELTLLLMWLNLVILPFTAAVQLLACYHSGTQPLSSSTLQSPLSLSTLQSPVSSVQNQHCNGIRPSFLAYLLTSRQWQIDYVRMTPSRILIIYLYEIVLFSWIVQATD